MRIQKGIQNCYKVPGFPRDPELWRRIRRGPRFHIFSVLPPLKPLSLKLPENIFYLGASCSAQGKWKTSMSLRITNVVDLGWKGVAQIKVLERGTRSWKISYVFEKQRIIVEQDKWVLWACVGMENRTPRPLGRKEEDRGSDGPGKSSSERREQGSGICSNTASWTSVTRMCLYFHRLGNWCERLKNS